MSFLDTRHKKKSFTLTTLILSVLLLLLFYIGLTYLDPPIENGIAVNFGTMDYGSGNIQPKEKIRSEPKKVQSQPMEQAQPETQPETDKEEPVEKVLTSEVEETIKIKQQREAKRKADEVAKKAQLEAERMAREKRVAEERIKQEQDAKKKSLDALIGGIGKSDGSATGSEGDDNKAGDKGQPDGNPYATSYYGVPGNGNGTGGYGLKGRSLVNQGKVQQKCNEEGRVVVRIVVGRNGRVIQATPGVKGTTNNAPCLLQPAKETAQLHRWNLDANAPAEQIGFVVVNFKLGQ
ncbi:energy transducer TonB [Muricauda sp. JGD-17]|uniref:Energy transducer TonB n=1 Tax=Flagellimonas ochracea TaxID=2696472 RepID=A0A964TDE1_9FLAO|nr:energy transducer TonB [Allomuricauda ochracea]NAY92839.1 energy transducer TonB [Allomuricauda ochracea]